MIIQELDREMFEKILIPKTNPLKMASNHTKERLTIKMHATSHRSVHSRRYYRSVDEVKEVEEKKNDVPYTNTP